MRTTIIPPVQECDWTLWEYHSHVLSQLPSWTVTLKTDWWSYGSVEIFNTYSSSPSQFSQGRCPRHQSCKTVFKSSCDSSVGEWMYLPDSPLCDPGSITGHGGVFQDSFHWPITLCQRGRKCLNLPLMAPDNLWTSRRKAKVQPLTLSMVGLLQTKAEQESGQRFRCHLQKLADIPDDSACLILRSFHSFNHRLLVGETSVQIETLGGIARYTWYAFMRSLLFTWWVAGRNENERWTEGRKYRQV